MTSNNVTRIPLKATKPVRQTRDIDKIGTFIADRPDGHGTLGQVEWSKDGSVVEVLYLTGEQITNRRGQLQRVSRKYTVDSLLEGVRLLYRVGGFPEAIITRTDRGFRVTMPAISAGGNTDYAARAGWDERAEVAANGRPTVAGVGIPF